MTSRADARTSVEPPPDRRSGVVRPPTRTNQAHDETCHPSSICTGLASASRCVATVAPIARNTARIILHRVSGRVEIGYRAESRCEGVDTIPFLLGPPNSQLLLKKDRMLVRKGARENRADPASSPSSAPPPWRMAHASSVWS
jgi:hypothetical protein